MVIVKPIIKTYLCVSGINIIKYTIVWSSYILLNNKRLIISFSLCSCSTIGWGASVHKGIAPVIVHGLQQVQKSIWFVECFRGCCFCICWTQCCLGNSCYNVNCHSSITQPQKLAHAKRFVQVQIDQ